MDDKHHTDLSVRDVLERLKARHSSHYLDLYNVMKGVTLAVAGVSLLEIVVRHWSAGRFLLWLAAFAGSVLTYYGATAGAALLNSRPSLPDIMFPMLLSVSELMLIYRPGLDIGSKAEWIPTDWFALLAAWCVQCGFVIFFVSRGLRSSRYTDTLKDVATAYRGRLRTDCVSAFGSGALSLAIFLVWHLHLVPDGRWVKGGAVALMLVFILGGIDSQRKASAEIDRRLEDMAAREEQAELAQAPIARTPGLLVFRRLLLWVGLGGRN